MLITINREIFRALPFELKKIYVYEKVCSSHEYIIDFEEEGNITNSIIDIINSNEKFNEEYGKIQKNGLKQVDETCLVPGFSEPSGYLQVGKLLIAPFDWSWDEEGNYDYSFTVYYSIEYCKERK
jgi:hypothetical protein